MQLTHQQQEALEAIRAFLADKDSQVFILRGYAGTGKTTMVSEVNRLGRSLHRHVLLMAPTGRAAKVLRTKTGCAADTIHRSIYESDGIEVKVHDDQGNLITTSNQRLSKSVDELHLYFKIKDVKETFDPARLLFIVDEASMVGSRRADNEILHFGTDVLLDDVLTYAQPHLGGKVIFVGDPAQLPPVGDIRSAALQPDYFAAKGLGLRTYELTDIVRQGADSAILKNAMMVRGLLASEQRTTYVFDEAPGQVEQIRADQVVDRYVEGQPLPTIGDSVVICFSNAKAKEYNDRIRQHYYPGATGIMAGDVLQVVKNNGPTGLLNGDFVKVLSVAPAAERHTVPIWVSRHGERRREHVDLYFRSVEIITDDGRNLAWYILENLLENADPTISPELSKALYIDFLIRHGELRGDAVAMGSALRNDPYYNALAVKYGYAITGHKSQGGEWHTAYVDYTGRTGTDDDSLRWSYTATTRASHRLFGVNMPHLTPLTHFKVNAINRLAKPLANHMSLADVACALLPQAQPVRKARCNHIQAALPQTGCALTAIDQFQYLDRYRVATPDGPVAVDCLWNKDGIYTTIRSQQDNAYTPEVLAIFNQEPEYDYAIDYAPTLEALRLLTAKITSLCDELGIAITNIVERGHSTIFHLKTSGKYACIECFFNNAGFVTSAIPSSDLGADDALLNSLINKLN